MTLNHMNSSQTLNQGQLFRLLLGCKKSLKMCKRISLLWLACKAGKSMNSMGTSTGRLTIVEGGGSRFSIIDHVLLASEFLSDTFWFQHLKIMFQLVVDFSVRVVLESIMATPNAIMAIPNKIWLSKSIDTLTVKVSLNDNLLPL